MEVRQYQRIIFIIALIGFRSDKSLKHHKIEEKDDKQKWKLLCCILFTSNDHFQKESRELN